MKNLTLYMLFLLLLFPFSLCAMPILLILFENMNYMPLFLVLICIIRQTRPYIILTVRWKSFHC